jgi:hypothetical protein
MQNNQDLPVDQAGLPVIEPGQTVRQNATAVSAQLVPEGAGSNRVARFLCTVPCFIRFGLDPTATVDDLPLVANVPEYFVVPAGHKVAVLRGGGTDGILYVTVAQ